MSRNGGEATKVVVAVPPPFFEPGCVPKFLDPGRQHSRLEPLLPPQVPRSVAAAAAVALAGPHAGKEVLEWQGNAGLSLRQPWDPLDPVPWPPRLSNSRTDRLRWAAAPLALRRDASCDRGGAVLHWGDVIRLILEGDTPAVLSTAPDGVVAAVEAQLAAELAGSGREPRGFVAVTASPLQGPGAPSHRCSWQLRRAEPLDGAGPCDEVVRYGQLVRLGQPPAKPGGEEVLLACEEPRGWGGLTAAYIVLGRPAGFGHPDPRARDTKAFETAFQLFPADGDAAEGLPVDLRQAVRIEAAGPRARLHGVRCLGLERGAARLGTAIGQRAPPARTAVVGEARELRVEGVMPGAAPAAAWRLERLALPPKSVESCARAMAEAHAGLPRKLLGRALKVPPANLRAALARLPIGQETNFSRWLHLRGSVLRRVHERGPFAFCKFRKALASNRLAVVAEAELARFVRAPMADELPGPDERVFLTAAEVSSFLRADYGIKLSDDDLALVADTFAMDGGSKEDSDFWVDVDVFTDALRGEASPGRHRVLGHLYSLLQQEACLPLGGSLTVGWIERRLLSAVPVVRPGEPVQEFRPDQLLATLPLLRAHTALTRLAFVRWVADLSYYIPGHAALVAKLHETWGACPDLELAQERERQLWNFRGPPVLPPPPSATWWDPEAEA